MIKPEFDEWMSGRYWLGDKAPAEGFYGRYKPHEIGLMRASFVGGVNYEPYRARKLGAKNDHEIYLCQWSYEMGIHFRNKLNEKSE